jgi:hypothetical protein
MAFKDLNNEELAEIAEFFVVDIVAVNEDKPTKKELLAALNGGDEPVTWEQYNDIFVPTKEKMKSPEVSKAEAEAAELEAMDVADAKAAVAARPVGDVPVKFEGKNPRLDVVGLTFTQQHPYALVDPETAEYLVKNQSGFRLALPTEVADYYGSSR